MQTEALTPGARAIRSLDLQEVQRQIEAARVARTSADDMAREHGSLADEHRIEGRHMSAMQSNAASIAWRSRVVALDCEIGALMAKERKLRDELAQTTAEQRADMDDTHNYVAVPA